MIAKRSVTRFIALFAALFIALGAVTTVAAAAQPGDDAGRDSRIGASSAPQVQTPGTGLAPIPVIGGNLSAGKTIEDTNIENVFTITLTAQTEIDLETVFVHPNALVVLLIDTSASMDSSSLRSAREAATQFVNKFVIPLDENPKAGVLREIAIAQFGINAQTVRGFTSVKGGDNGLIAAINGLTSTTAGTNHEAAFLLARNLINARYNDTSNPVPTDTPVYVVVLSDGGPNRKASNSNDTSTVSVAGVSAGSGAGMTDDGRTSAMNGFNKLVGCAAGSNLSIFSLYFRTSTSTSGDPVAFMQGLTRGIGRYSDSGAAGLIDLLVETSEEILAHATTLWKVTDMLGDNVKFVGENEVDKKPGKTNVVYENAAGDVVWSVIDTVADENEAKTLFTYTASFDVRIDNTAAGYNAGSTHKTNKEAVLNYSFSFDGDENDIYEAKFHGNTGSPIQFPDVETFTGSLKFRKVDAESGDPVPDAKFTLSRPADAANGISAYTSGKVASDSDGFVEFTNIPSGHTYTLTETDAPNNYTKHADISVEVSYGQTRINGVLVHDGTAYLDLDEDDGEGDIDYYEVANTRIVPLTDIVINKVENFTNDPLSGAVFEMTRLDSASAEVASYEEYTASGGAHTFKKTRPGIYSLEETTPPAGYIKSDKVYYVYIKDLGGSSGTETYFWNPAAEFPIDGLDDAGNLAALKSSQNWMQAASLSVPNVKSAAFTVIKLDEAGNPLNGAEFTLTKLRPAAVNGVPFSGPVIVGNEHTFTNVYPGVYSLVETTLPAGYHAGAETYYMLVDTPENARQAVVRFWDNSEAFPVEALNNPEDLADLKSSQHWGNAAGSLEVVNVKLASITVRKVYIDNASSVPLGGALFTLTNENGSVVGAETSDDDDGTVTFEGLPPGAYTLSETDAPDGFAIINGSLSFEVDSTGIVRLDGETDPYNDDAEIVNEKLAEITLKKIDAITGAGLPNAKFTLYKGVDYYDEYLSGSDGSFKIEGLSGGYYILVEDIPPAGYTDDKTEVAFTVDNGAVTMDGAVASLITVTNRSIASLNADLEFVKVVFGSETVLSGASFNLSDGAGYNQNAVSGTDGKVFFGSLSPGTVYTLKETQAPEGFEIDVNTYYFRVVNGKTEVSGDLTDWYPVSGFRVENTPVTPTAALTFFKVDADSPSTVLAGAVFELYRGEEFKASAASGDDGAVNLAGLVPGDYTLKEITPPDKYMPNDSTYSFTVGSDGAITNYTGSWVELGGGVLGVANEKITNPVDLRFIKLNAETSEPLAGVTFEIYLDGVLFRSAVSESDGFINFTDLPPGAYELVESAGLPGFMVSAARYRFWVADGNLVIDTASGWSNDGENLAITNRPGYSGPNIPPEDPDDPPVIPDNPTEETDEIDGTDETDETDEIDETNETDEIDEVDEIGETDETDETGETDEIDETEETEEITEEINNHEEIPAEIETITPMGEGNTVTQVPNQENIYVEMSPENVPLGVWRDGEYHSVELQDDGTYIEFGPDDVPLGVWSQDENGDWVFDFNVPLSDFELPQTGEMTVMMLILAGGLLLTVGGMVMGLFNRRGKGAN